MYVVVTGLPGSGKTTLAAPLAARLGVALLAKDTIKETLWDTLGAGDRDWSQRLGGASMDLLWELAAAAPGAVIDAFIHRDHQAGLAALAERAPVAEVHCACPPDVARDRYARRRRHPCHFDTDQLADRWDTWVAIDAEPLGVGPLLRVDTTAAVDLAAVAGWVQASIAIA